MQFLLHIIGMLMSIPLSATVFFSSATVSMETTSTYEEMVDYSARSISIQSEYIGVDESMEVLGDVGRLMIPSVGVDVAVYYADETQGDYAQAIVDRQDSAVYTIWHGGIPYIADHWSQGFINIKDCKIGTKAYLKRPGSIDVFECVEVTTGHNLETDMITEDGIYIENKQGCDLCMFTCNGCWQNVWLVFFRTVS